MINSNKAVSDYSSPSPVQLIKGIIHLSNSKRTSKTSCKSKWCHIYAVILPIHLVHRPLKGWSLVCEVSVQQIENNINRWRTYRIQIVFIIVKSIFCKGPCKLCLRCCFSGNFIFGYHRLVLKGQYFTVYYSCTMTITCGL